MRIAKCINGLQITVTGSKGSVSIGKGWEGDLDRVLGVQVIPEKRDPEDESRIVEPERRIDVTIADMLGDHLNDANFTVAPPPNLKGPGKASPAFEPTKE